MSRIAGVPLQNGYPYRPRALSYQGKWDSSEGGRVRYTMAGWLRDSLLTGASATVCRAFLDKESENTFLRALTASLVWLSGQTSPAPRPVVCCLPSCLIACKSYKVSLFAPAASIDLHG